MTRVESKATKGASSILPLFLAFLSATMLSIAVASAQEPRSSTSYQSAPGTELSALTLGNFFSAGWTDAYAKRERETPDMALLRVTTNFLERELRVDYARTNNVASSKTLDTDALRALIAYGLNRRLMIEVISNYQWNTNRVGPNTQGATAGALLRFQLVDTLTSSYAVQASVTPANKGVGQTQDSVTYALAGFNDLQALLGLDRVGLYYSVQLENLLGSHAPGARTSDVSYDISLAKTWTEPRTPYFGNLTTFIEAFATTDLDGKTSGHTPVTLTPGVRFWFAPENSFMFGVDVPVTNPHPFSEVYRVTYILNF